MTAATVKPPKKNAEMCSLYAKLAHRYTDGFTEGCNNKIKVLKRNAYGYKNFRRFKNRILHIFSHMQLNKEQAAAY